MTIDKCDFFQFRNGEKIRINCIRENVIFWGITRAHDISFHTMSLCRKRLNANSKLSRE